MTSTPVILTVCIGNLHRSPVAERLLRQRLGRSARVESAGVGARDGFPMDPAAAAELVRLGGDPEGFATRRLTRDIVAGADLVLALTRDLRTEVLRVHPGALKRAFTLGELATIVAGDGTGDGVGGRTPGPLPAFVADAARRRPQGAAAPDVVDPHGGSAQRHRDTADAIAAYVDLLSPPLLAALTSPVA